ncbi:hypothetical protein [Corynebacterium sp.]|uniref:hypothetical protein n=1 Tax=Corynebacterium sp. TaxID=1720 RepID=UPI0028A5D9A5|nr:hypothetical protein [Corynebacterium sp.]
MAKLGTYSVRIDRDPNDTPLQKGEKLLAALQDAKAQVDEQQRCEEQRKSKGFFSRMFG